MSLLVVGTVALDTVRTPSGIRRDILGGSAAHFCMSARLFTRVALVAVVGRDFPKKYIRFLQRKGIDTASLQAVEGKTFRWHGEYKKEDFNTALTLATELGVLASSKIQIARHHRAIPNIFLANIDPDIQAGLLELIRAPRLVGLDSMNLWIAHKRKQLFRLMRSVDLFVANDAEARALSGEANLIAAAKSLRRAGPRLIVIKKGEHGVFFFSDDVRFSFPAYPVERVVDPTGAGDTFAGGLMGHLSTARRLTAQTLKEAVLYAATIASFNVEGFGIIKTANLTRPQVRRRMKELTRFFSV